MGFLCPFFKNLKALRIFLSVISFVGFMLHLYLIKWISIDACVAFNCVKVFFMCVFSVVTSNLNA